MDYGYANLPNRELSDSEEHVPEITQRRPMEKADSYSFILRFIFFGSIIVCVCLYMYFHNASAHNTAFLSHQEATIRHSKCKEIKFQSSDKCVQVCANLKSCVIAEYKKNKICKICSEGKPVPGMNRIFLKQEHVSKPTLKRPYVYVYEIGNDVYDKASGISKDFCIGDTQGQSIGRFDPFGTEMSPGVFASDAQYSLSFLFHLRFAESSHRVHDKAKADMMFVDFPVKYSNCKDKKNPDRHAHMNKLFDSDDFKQYAGVIPHFMIRDHDSFHAWPDFGMFNTAPLNNMYLLSMESQRNTPWLRSDQAPFQFSIPFFTPYHIRDAETLNSHKEQMRNSHRTNLFAFCGGIRPGRNTHHRKNGRKEFVEQLSNMTNHILKGTSWEGINLFELGSSNCSELYSRSVFCYNQGADTYTRKGNFDSWIQGCITIIQFDWIRLNHNYPGLHLEENEHYAVLDPTMGNVTNMIGKFDRSKVHVMREKIISKVDHMIYSTAYPEFEDAFENTLTELWKLMKDEPPNWRDLENEFKI